VRKQALVALSLVVPMLIAGAVIWANAEPATPIEGDTVAFHTWTEQDPAYEGGRAACRRCHLAEYRSWERTPHATAFETLPEESRGDANCVKCHTTGYGEATGFTSIADTPELAGVGCEACHGPGSLYKDREVMESREASVAAGLNIPDEATCTACHNSESPTFPGSFNFEEMKAAGVHEIG
jgi:hypothetical protein